MVSHREQEFLIVQTPHHLFALACPEDYPPQHPVTFFFRPEDAYLAVNACERNAIRGTIIEHEYLGAEILTRVCDDDQHMYVVSNYIKNETFFSHEGQHVYMNIPPAACKTVV
jgi:hypothetical protein